MSKLVSGSFVLAILLAAGFFAHQRNYFQSEKLPKSQLAMDLIKLKVTPQDSELVVKIAKAYQFGGDVKASVDFLEAQKTSFPHHPEIAIWHANGLSLMAGNAANNQEKARWAQKAIAALDETAAKYPDQWFVRYMRGKNSQGWPPMFGRKKLAIGDFETVLAIDAKGEANIPHEIISETKYLLAINYHEEMISKERSQQLIKELLESYPQSQEAKSWHDAPLFALEN